MTGFVLVTIGERRMALPAARVREVAQVVSVTPVPRAPAPVSGLLQLRGQILPVLDLAGPVPRTPRPNDSIVVVELGPVRAALLCDRIGGVQADPGGAEVVDVGAVFDELRKGS